MSARIWILVGLIGSVAVSSVRAQGHTERGAVIGGVAGALAGAAIGKHNDETGVGALVGGAAGLVTGAVVGNSLDERERRNQGILLQQQRQQVYQRLQADAASIGDVISMTKSGVGDSVIINHIQTHGVQRRLEVPDVIYLHQHGVSEPVITAMQRGRLAASAPVVVTEEVPAPVIVEQRYYAPRPVYIYREPAHPHWHSHYHYYDHHYVPRHHHSHTTFSFGF